MLFISGFLFGFNPKALPGESSKFVKIEQGQTFAQSFTALHTGLDSIVIQIKQPDQPNAHLRLRLFENLPDRQLLYEAVVPFPQPSNNPNQILNFPIQKASYLKDYFLELEWQGPFNLLVGTTPADHYDQGSMYINGSPVEAQLIFSLQYNPIFRMLGLLRQIAIWTWQLFLTMLILILPGWAIMLAGWKQWSTYDSLTKVSISAGISFALYPVLMLLTDTIDFHPGEIFFVWLPMLISIAYLIWRYRSGLTSILINPLAFVLSAINNLKSNITWPGFTTFVIVILVIAVRLWAIRTLSTPMWGDSYQHTVITQLIMDNGGLFQSWLPYAPYKSLTIHFGFHANSSVYAWISNSSARQAAIWMGQMANIFAVIGLYPVAKRLSIAGKWIGPAVILVAGLISGLPNYYLNWGRYAQLSGLVILPVITFLLLETLFSREKRPKQIIICAMTLTGMALSYYRAPLFLLIFLPVFLVELINWTRQTSIKNIGWLWSSLSILAFTMILLLPLLPRLSQGRLINFVSYTKEIPLTTLILNTWEQWLKIDQYYPVYLLIITGIAFVFAVYRKDWRISLLPFGILLLQGYAFGVLVDFPLSNFIDVFSILILLYILFGLMGGYLIDQILSVFGKRYQAVGSILLILLSFGYALYAKDVPNKMDYEYVTWADQRAFEWIKSDTLDSSLFLVDGFSTHNNYSAVGSDAGWWIPLLANRANTMPPQYAILDEQPIQEGYSRWIVEVQDEFRQYSPATLKGLESLCKWEISHIYIGQKQGVVGQAEPLLNWTEWPEVDWLDLVYAEDRVRIFAIDPDFCD